MGEGPKHGVYVGKARDVTCPGDHVTYEFVVYTSHRCSLECIPEKNFFHGGQPPWKCEGNYEVDEDDIVMEVTQQDVTGPRRDSDVHLEISGNDVTFRKTRLAWVGGPPALPSQDPVKLKKAQLQNEEEEAARRKLELETAREEMDKERARQEELARKEKEELEQLREELRRQREAQEAEAAKRRADLEKQKEELRAIEEEKARLARLRQEEFESQEAHEREAKQVQEELNRQREALKALEREREELKEQKEKEARQKQLQREEQKHEAAQMAAEGSSSGAWKMSTRIRVSSSGTMQPTSAARCDWSSRCAMDVSFSTPANESTSGKASGSCPAVVSTTCCVQCEARRSRERLRQLATPQGAQVLQRLSFRYLASGDSARALEELDSSLYELVKQRRRPFAIHRRLREEITIRSISALKRLPKCPFAVENPRSTAQANLWLPRCHSHPKHAPAAPRAPVGT
ncbi:unnamed protein product [Durusdinium trenchii]|uniref:Uncharacterized protein n=1 Tax=Durusdinium trenchii TaxID=1381693 RepID=A0ABP0JS82_9DINO